MPVVFLKMYVYLRNTPTTKEFWHVGEPGVYITANIQEICLFLWQPVSSFTILFRKHFEQYLYITQSNKYTIEHGHTNLPLSYSVELYILDRKVLIV